MTINYEYIHTSSNHVDKKHRSIKQSQSFAVAWTAYAVFFFYNVAIPTLYCLNQIIG